MKVTRAKLEAAVKRELPGYRLASRQASPLSEMIGAEPDSARSSSPSIDELRSRFLKNTASKGAKSRSLGVPDSKRPARPAADAQPRSFIAESRRPSSSKQTVVLTVEPEDTTDSGDPAFQKRVAVVIDEDGNPVLEAVQG